MSFVHTIPSTFPAPPFVMHLDVYGHRLCYQIDGKEGAYLSVLPAHLTPFSSSVDACDSSLTSHFRNGRCRRKTSSTPSPA